MGFTFTQEYKHPIGLNLSSVYVTLKGNLAVLKRDEDQKYLASFKEFHFITKDAQIPLLVKPKMFILEKEHLSDPFLAVYTKLKQEFGAEHCESDE